MVTLKCKEKIAKSTEISQKLILPGDLFISAIQRKKQKLSISSGTLL
jgi:hypothetical protein